MYSEYYNCDTQGASPTQQLLWAIQHIQKLEERIAMLTEVEAMFAAAVHSAGGRLEIKKHPMKKLILQRYDDYETGNIVFRTIERFNEP